MLVPKLTFFFFLLSTSLLLSVCEVLQVAYIRHFQLNWSLDTIKVKAILGGFSSYFAFVQLNTCEFTLRFHLDDHVCLVGPHILFSFFSKGILMSACDIEKSQACLMHRT